MDIQKQLAMAAVAKANKRAGVEPPPQASSASPAKKAPIDTGRDPNASASAKNALAAGLAAKFGGQGPRSPPATAAPPPVTSSSEGKLSSGDDAQVAEYRKMLKMGIPAGAVRNKMVAEGAPTRVMNAVLAEAQGPDTAGAPRGPPRAAPPPKPTPKAGGVVSKLSPAEEKTAAQYRKMVKLGLPDGAVIHKMTADGVSQKIQDSVLAGEVPASEASQATPASVLAPRPAPRQPKPTAPVPVQARPPAPPQPAEAPAAPPPQVRAAPPQATAKAPTAKPPVKRPSAPIVVPKLAPDEEEVAEYYRDQVRMGKPLNMVQIEMFNDGAPPHIQDAVKATFASAASAPAPKPAPKPSPPVVTPAAQPARSPDPEVNPVAVPSPPAKKTPTLLETPGEPEIIKEPPHRPEADAPPAETPKKEKTQAQSVAQQIAVSAVANRSQLKHHEAEERQQTQALAPTAPARPPVPAPAPTPTAPAKTAPATTAAPVAARSAPSSKKRQRKPRKERQGGRVLDDGAEQHCACIVM